MWVLGVRLGGIELGSALFPVRAVREPFEHVYTHMKTPPPLPDHQIRSHPPGVFSSRQAAGCSFRPCR